MEVGASEHCAYNGHRSDSCITHEGHYPFMPEVFFGKQAHQRHSVPSMDS